MYVRRAAALGLAAALALAGCSGGGTHPRVLPTLATVSASPTATPTAAVDVPAAARVKTSAGAAAFARYWFQQLDLAYQGKATLDATLSAPSCSVCTKFRTAAESPDGQRVQESTFPALQAEAKPLVGNRCSVSIAVDVPARHVLDSSGHVLRLVAAEPHTLLELVAEWQGGGWRTLAINRVVLR